MNSWINNWLIFGGLTSDNWLIDVWLMIDLCCRLHEDRCTRHPCNGAIRVHLNCSGGRRCNFNCRCNHSHHRISQSSAWQTIIFECTCLWQQRTSFGLSYPRNWSSGSMFLSGNSPSMALTIELGLHRRSTRSDRINRRNMNHLHILKDCFSV